MSRLTILRASSFLSLTATVILPLMVNRGALAQQTKPQYVVTEVTKPPSAEANGSYAVDINDRGQILYQWYDPNNQFNPWRLSILTPGDGFKDVSVRPPVPPGYTLGMFGVSGFNNDGTIVGNYDYYPTVYAEGANIQNNSYGFISGPGVGTAVIPSNLPTLAKVPGEGYGNGGGATAINDRGDVISNRSVSVGSFYPRIDAASEAAVWNPRTGFSHYELKRGAELNGGDSFYYTALNDAGDVAAFTPEESYIDTQGLKISIPKPINNTRSHQITQLGNNLSAVVTQSTDYSYNNYTRTFLRDGDEYHEYQPVGGNNRVGVSDRNNKGTAVGWSGYVYTPWPLGIESQDATAWLDGADDPVSLAGVSVAPRMSDGSWALQTARKVTDDGTILASGTRTEGEKKLYTSFVLTPIQQAPRAFATERNVKPISRLGRWNNTLGTFEPVSPDAISNGNVHVLTHGWAPGELDNVQRNPGVLEWNLDDGSGNWMEDMARTIAEVDPGSEIIGFSWVDHSATANNLQPWLSQAHTSEMGNELSFALDSLLSSDFNGRLQLMGHSHGAKVATIAAGNLEHNGISVDQLTIWDSPDGVASRGINSGNFLDSYLSQLKSDFGIGREVNETFVDSYFSEFGIDYNVDGVVNVKLNGDHSYPYTWYNEASTQSHNGLNWFTGIRPPGQYYEQDSDVGPYVLRTAEGDVLGIRLASRSLETEGYFSDGNVTHVNGGVELREGSPAYWDLVLVLENGDVLLSFDYQFFDVGDGDQLGLWIDDQLYFIATGEFAGTEMRRAMVDLTLFDRGSHLMTLALHSTGESSAGFFAGNFQITSVVPEPSALSVMAGCFLLLKRRRLTSARHDEKLIG